MPYDNLIVFTTQENSDTIISLKEKKINRKTLKWWLFW